MDPKDILCVSGFSNKVMSPELTKDLKLIEALANQVDMLVIDEAHCIFQWGHSLDKFAKLIAATNILA